MSKQKLIYNSVFLVVATFASLSAIAKPTAPPQTNNPYTCNSFNNVLNQGVCKPDTGWKPYLPLENCEINKKYTIPFVKIIKTRIDIGSTIECDLTKAASPCSWSYMAPPPPPEAKLEPCLDALNAIKPSH